MLPNRLWRSTPFRLAVAYAILFAASSILVYALTYVLLRAEIYATLDNSIAETYGVIESSYSPGDVEDLIGTMQAFSNVATGDRRVFFLSDSAGKVLAGNLPRFRATRGIESVSAEELGLSGQELFRITTGTIDGNNLLVGQSLEATEDLTQIILLNFIWMSLATLLLAMGAGIFLAQRAQKRIDAIADTMTKVSEGNLEKRVPLTKRGDDIDVVSGQINAALDRLSDLVEGMRQVSADIAHDLKTPLNRLKLILEEAALREDHGEGVSTQLQEALQECDQINSTFQALLRISQIEAGARKTRFASLDFGQLFTDLFEIFADVMEDNGQTLVFSPETAPSCPIEGDKQLLKQLLVNLLENAITHCPAGTVVTLGLENIDGECRAFVSDNGPGIALEEREKVFRRLYRLDKSRNSSGHGLGLSLVKAIADLHGMDVAIEDNHPGARFLLTWRRGQTRAEAR